MTTNLVVIIVSMVSLGFTLGFITCLAMDR
jgi:hypothetical protein